MPGLCTVDLPDGTGGKYDCPLFYGLFPPKYINEYCHVGMWPSLVGHCVRDAGVARSNRAIPTIFDGIAQRRKPSDGGRFRKKTLKARRACPEEGGVPRGTPWCRKEERSEASGRNAEGYAPVTFLRVRRFRSFPGRFANRPLLPWKRSAGRGRSACLRRCPPKTPS